MFWTNAHPTVVTDTLLSLNDPSKNTISLPSVETEDGATSDNTTMDKLSTDVTTVHVDVNVPGHCPTAVVDVVHAVTPEVPQVIDDWHQKHSGC